MPDSIGQQGSGSQNSTQQNTFVIDNAGEMPKIQETGGYDQLHLRSKTGGQTVSFASKDKGALEVIQQIANGNTDWEVQTEQMDKSTQTTDAQRS